MPHNQEKKKSHTQLVKKAIEKGLGSLTDRQLETLSNLDEIKDIPKGFVENHTGGYPDNTVLRARLALGLKKFTDNPEHRKSVKMLRKIFPPITDRKDSGRGR